MWFANSTAWFPSLAAPLTSPLCPHHTYDYFPAYQINTAVEIVLIHGPLAYKVRKNWIKRCGSRWNYTFASWSIFKFVHGGPGSDIFLPNEAIWCFIHRTKTNNQLLWWNLIFQMLELCHPMYYSQNQHLLTMLIVSVLHCTMAQAMN